VILSQEYIMIVSLSISNFRSFLNEQTFSLVASTRLPLKNNHPSHLISIPDNKKHHALKTAVLYGANGAGKSNLFKAMEYLKRLALKKHANKNNGTNREAFRFSNEIENSSFDLQFVIQEKLYCFGCVVNDQYIVEEWLVQIIGEEEKIIYERTTNDQGNVTIELGSHIKASNKLKAMAVIGGLPNQSFLATIEANLVDQDDYGMDISSALTWFKEYLVLISPNSSFGGLSLKLADEPQFQSFAGSFLKQASTGVEKLSTIKQEISEKELQDLLSQEDISHQDVISHLQESINSDKTGIFINLGENKELLVERTDKNRYYRLAIQTGHQHQMAEPIFLDLSEESDGTRRLLDLMPALYRLRNTNAVYFIDEIDRSMHPMLTREFLKFFLQSCEDGQRQIIVTTHESSLLDLELLRRDEIYFTEKDLLGATHLYPLSDFKIRSDLEIRKHYLQGRFGAIPFLGNLDNLSADIGV